MNSNTPLRIFTYFNFLDTICIIHFTRQMVQFYVSHCCKYNLHVTTLETLWRTDGRTDGHFYSIRDLRGRYFAKHKENLKCLKLKIWRCDDICLRSPQKPETCCTMRFKIDRRWNTKSSYVVHVEVAGEQNEDLRAHFHYYANLYPFLKPEFSNKGFWCSIQ